MRRIALALALLCFAPVAHAFDYKLLAGTDFLLATGPSGNINGAELGITVRGALLDVGNRADFKIDFRGREAFIGNSTINELWELNGIIRGLWRQRIDITLGRFRAPGNFGLAVDGAVLTIHYTPWLRHSVYGGLRAFSTGRRNTWMGPNPVALPLVGTALFADTRRLYASLSFSYGQDVIEQPTLTRIPWDAATRFERHIEPELFLDAQLSTTPVDSLWVSAGASFGSRYDLRFDAANPYAPANIGFMTLGAFGAYGGLSWRPLKRLDISYSTNFERVRVVQSQLTILNADGSPVQTAGGSFYDNTVLITGRPWRALRIYGQYRLRVRENTDIEHHAVAGVRGDDLWKGIGAFASIGYDYDYLNAGQPNTRVHNRIIYSAGLSWTRAFIDLRAGILYTDGIGSGLLFSRQTTTATGQSPSQLFPYTLETNRIAYVRAFALIGRHVFAGLDVEENLDALQIRALAQLGVAR